MIAADPLSPRGIDVDAVLQEVQFEQEYNGLAALTADIIRVRRERASIARDLRLTEEAIEYAKAELVASGQIEGKNEETRKAALKVAERAHPALQPLVTAYKQRRDDWEHADEQCKELEFRWETTKRRLNAAGQLLTFLAPAR